MEIVERYLAGTIVDKQEYEEDAHEASLGAINFTVGSAIYLKVFAS